MNMLKALIKVCVVLSIPLAIPASGAEIGTLWQHTSLFHTPLSNKRCSAIPAGKPHRIPGYDFSHQTTDDCDYFYPSHTSVAMHLFYVEWVNKFRDDDGRILKALNNLQVEHATYQRLVSRIYSIDGVYRPKPTVVNGLAGNHGKYIFVWIGQGSHPKLYKTSLVHELVHVAIYALNFGEHGDPDHEGEKYKGWSTMHTKFIEDTNKILESMDL